MSSQSDSDDSIERPNFKLVRSETLAHDEAISVVKFSYCGDWLASAAYGTTIKIWSVETGVLHRTLDGHRMGISDVAWSKDGKLLVSASDDKTLKIWKFRSGKCVKTLRGHSQYVICCDFNPDRTLVISGSYDETVKLWNVRTGTCETTIRDFLDQVTGVNFSSDGSSFLASSLDGFCHVWQTTTRNRFKTLKDYDPEKREYISVSFAKFSENSKFVLTSTHSNYIKLWNLERENRGRRYLGQVNGGYLITADISVGKWVVSGSQDHKVNIWHLQKKMLLQSLTGHTDAVVSTSCHRKCEIIATAGVENDRTIKLWKNDYLNESGSDDEDGRY